MDTQKLEKERMLPVRTALHEEKRSRHGMGPLVGKASTSHLSQWRILAMIKVSLTSPPDELLLHPREKRPHRERDWKGLL